MGERTSGDGAAAAQGGQPSQQEILRAKEIAASTLIESLGFQIQRLSLSRREAYERASVYRRSGQLVPSSVRQDFLDNADELQRALQRYGEATTSRADGSTRP